MLPVCMAGSGNLMSVTPGKTPAASKQGLTKLTGFLKNYGTME